MEHENGKLAEVLAETDLGSDIAELDSVLEGARVETSVFSDLAADRIDLIPGTKGSGKSALFRLFVDFLAESMLRQRRVVLAHGVRSHGDSVFLAFRDEFEQLSEDDFVSFWCIYLVSLAHEQFIKSAKFQRDLAEIGDQVQAFKRACERARIPEIKAQLSLRSVLEWALAAVKRINPKLGYDVRTESFELSLFDPEQLPPRHEEPGAAVLPKYLEPIRASLDAILESLGLTLWLMVDRLDEIFPRRSQTETRALRGLLKSLQVLRTDRIRVKIFLRDDILAQITETPEGFTGLTHLTARQADSLRWSEDQILTLIAKRFASSDALMNHLGADRENVDASSEYRLALFYRIFPRTVHRGTRQSNTLRWIYNHTKDGRDVVTPRDVIFLLTKAKQWQENACRSDPSGIATDVITSEAIQHGLTELSKHKRDTLLKAEFPHFWPHIERFRGGKTEYSEAALQRLLGKQHASISRDLLAVGFLAERRAGGARTLLIPSVFREGLELTQGRIS